MKFVTALFLLTITTLEARAASTHLDNFKIQQCREESCVKASGPKGYISADGGILAAEKVSVEFTGTKSEKILCDSFRYEIRNQYLVCDSRDLKGQTFTVNENLQRKEY